MEDVIYRFRPVSRLLDNDRKSGELDSQYIYFAKPSQLNDPLEGYKNLFFEGDNIAWNNLIRNYIQCLINHCMLVRIDPDQTYDLAYSVLDIAVNAPPQYVALSDRVIERFLAEPIIANFMTTFPSLGRSSRSEVYNYLDILHFNALGVVTECLVGEGLLPATAANINDFKKAERLERIQAYTHALTDPDIDQENRKSLMDVYFRSSREKHLLERYKDHETKHIAVSLHELLAFPDKYCEALEKAVYPEWSVACFMPDCTDSAIWGSYGGNHKDVCLEFHVEKAADVTGLRLSMPSATDGDDKPLWRENILRFHEVSYGEDFANVDFFNSLGGLRYDDIYKYWLGDATGNLSSRASDLLQNPDQWRKEYWEKFHHSATVKLMDWSKEKEYRLIYYSNLFDFSDGELRKLKYDFKSLKGIVFGINTSTDDKCKLISRIEALCVEHKREEFIFYQARYDHITKIIARDELKSIRVGYKP